MLVGLIIISPEGIIESVNPRTEQIFDLSTDGRRHPMSLNTEARLYSMNSREDLQQFMEECSTRRSIALRIRRSRRLEDFQSSFAQRPNTDGRFISPIFSMFRKTRSRALEERIRIDSFTRVACHRYFHPRLSDTTERRRSGRLTRSAMKVVHIAERNTPV